MLLGGGALLLRNERGEWELPGGRPEDGEGLEECLAREALEETGLGVRVGPRLDTWVYEVLPGRRVSILTYGCSVFGPEAPVLSREHSGVGLFRPDELDRIPLPGGYAASILSWARRVDGGGGRR